MPPPPRRRPSPNRAAPALSPRSPTSSDWTSPTRRARSSTSWPRSWPRGRSSRCSACIGGSRKTSSQSRRRASPTRRTASPESQRRDPAVLDPKPLLAGTVLDERALVGTVDADVDDAVGSVPQHEGAGKPAEPHAVLQLIGGLDLGDPDVVLVPVGGDHVLRRAQRGEEVAEQSAHGGGPLGAMAVRGQQ